MSSALIPEHDLSRLKAILLGAEYHELIALQKRLSDPKLFSADIAEVVAEAIEIRNKKDDDVSSVLSHSVQDAIRKSVQTDTQSFADALYPVMGPAIRKSISEAVSGMLERFNVALENSVSVRSLLWRFDAWRTGKPYSEVVMLKTLVYRVEQVFLIHNETSLLLHHIVSQDVVIKDASLVSGMLSAIQDFVKDSFSTSSDENLTRMSMGELTILIERGPSAILACAVRGEVPKSYRLKMQSSLEQAHAKYAKKFDAFDGDVSGFYDLEEILRPCLQRQSHPAKKRKPWIWWIVALVILAVLSYWLYLKMQATHRWESALERLNQSPGIIVLNASRENEHSKITLLRDTLSEDPYDLIANVLPDKERPQLIERGFISLEDSFRLKRIQSQIDAPDTVSLQVDGQVLSISGTAAETWAKSLGSIDLHWLGVTNLDTRNLNLTRTPKDQPEPKPEPIPEVKQEPTPDYTQVISEIKHKIIRWRISFEPNKSITTSTQDDLYNDLAELIIQLNKYRPADSLALSFIGYTDSSGTDEKNDIIAMKRAQYVHDRLVQSLQKQAPDIEIKQLLSATILSAIKLYKKEEREEGRFVAIVLSDTGA